jgi:hypothetical protein
LDTLEKTMNERERLALIKRQLSTSLLAIPGVWSVSADGVDDKGDPALLVGVEKRIPELVDAVLSVVGDVPVVFEVIGRISKR